MGVLPESLSAFVARQRASQPDWSAQIVNPTDAAPIRRMSEQLYGSLDIEVGETELEGIDDSLVLILRDGKVVATSPMRVLSDTLLLVNSDLYKSGVHAVEDIEVPEVILELSDTVFTLRGYPASNTEKLVLTLIARYVEQQALAHQTGTLRSSFQRLSRIDDESGTREVYERLGQVADLDIHVYGLPDWDPTTALDVTSHGLESTEIRQNWFVVYQSSSGEDVALVANEVGGNTWKGYWTFDAEEIQQLEEYIRERF